MVRRIRIRGHVVRLCGLPAHSSRGRPPSCSNCGITYNDGSHRKCSYLCCGFDDCLNCVIYVNKFNCIKFKQYLEFKTNIPTEDQKKKAEDNKMKLNGKDKPCQDKKLPKLEDRDVDNKSAIRHRPKIKTIECDSRLVVPRVDCGYSVLKKGTLNARKAKKLVVRVTRSGRSYGDFIW